jgi:protein gp37
LDDLDRATSYWPNIKTWVSLEPMASDLEFGLNCPSMASFDLIVLGFASGKKALPVNDSLKIARSIRDQCNDYEHVSFFFKQWGEFAPVVHSQKLKRMGKEKAGRLLDGVEHTEMPESWK